MTEENQQDHTKSSRPLPHCKALLLCEKVTESVITGKITLHNLIEAFQSRVFPGRSTRFVAFLQVYDGIGRYALSVEINDLTDGSTIAETRLPDLDFPDRLATIHVMAPFEFVPLPRPGRCELVVLIDGHPLASQHFNAEVDYGDR